MFARVHDGGRSIRRDEEDASVLAVHVTMAVILTRPRALYIGRRGAKVPVHHESAKLSIALGIATTSIQQDLSWVLLVGETKTGILAI